MRRPLKPFVTEYKSPNRKTKDLFETPPGTPALEQEQPTAPAAVRAFSPPTDSYEEALRAADALFGGQAARHVPEVPKAAEHPQGGRILRAIEETAPDPFAQLEAERAPKRRGRKPGSKNRPKLPLAATQVALLTPAVAPVEAPRRKPMAAPEPQVEVTRERFAWVRTKLRPGEQWKRRLPKVAW